ncbi:Tat pathway signal protein [Streptomyces sp. WZ.A104]|uniref:endonuclease/exonuclease/phosphatase family protein n=1 Tax=Streptomyces sp. WZ.A104 TaxID=2023771 RepID=UPI000BBC48E6|nr:endonuclease/exonuclease/phosphatase family protein [Streptomyces sp. WZ.A104]PCG86415.1 Tat pathway signal protein [Streptomyces sp. WZ.A104]
MSPRTLPGARDETVRSVSANASPPPVPRPVPATRGRRRATGLLIGTTAAWALFLGLGQALSGRWWLWLLPDLAPPPAFVAVPALLIVLSGAVATRRARRWLLPVLAVLLAAGVGRAGLHWGALVPGGGPGPAPAGALKVFSWNTLYWDTTDDPAAFHRHLRSKDADVYLLQEHLSREDGRHTEIDRLDRLRAEFPGYHLVARGELVTLSRYPVVAAPEVGPGRPPGPSSSWRERFEWHKVLRTDVDVAGTVVSFYNVHIPVQLDIERSWLSPGFYRVVRDTDAVRKEHYAALLRDARANPHPLLISGDFNTTPAMGDLDGLRGEFRDALPAGSSFLPGTWGGEGLPLWRLDWTFTDERLRVHRYALVSASGLSDHRGQEMLVSPAG